jgi:hypothetical protein
VQRVATAGRDDKLGAQQLPARILSRLPEHYPVILDRVVDLLSCPRHASYLLALLSGRVWQ